MSSELEEARRWVYWEDLPPEMEEEIIEKVARFVAKHRLGTLVSMVLETVMPISFIGSEITLMTLGPYLEFIGVDPYIALFRKRKNVRRLIQRIEELEREMEGE